jgi:NCAIR mutase (PurE)-related protein
MKPGKAVAKNKKRVAGKAIREKNVAKFATKAGKMAVKEAIEKNVSIAFAKKGRIVTLHPDGTEEKGEKLPKKVQISAKKRTIIFR